MRVIIGRRLFIASIPVVFYLGSLFLTTTLGAIYFLTPEGKLQLFKFLQSFNQEASEAIGSFPYLFLTFAPYLITPLFAGLGIYATSRLLSRAPTMTPEAPAWTLWSLFLVAFAFCLYRLSLFDAIVPTAGSYRENILRRTFLLEHLGLTYFVGVYAILPMAAVMFLSRFVLRKRIFDMIGFVLAALCFDYLVLTTYLKSHFLVFGIMLAATVIFARIKWYWLPVVAALSIALFIPAEYALSGIAKSSITNGSKEGRAEAGKEENAEATKGGLLYFRYFLIQGLSFRMASAVPYYVAAFENPSERCGIEAHTVRKLLSLPGSNCILPTKIFPLMYPDIKWVEGYSPASSPISAYGELGLTWSAVVMALSGLMLGILGGLAAVGRGPIFVAIGVASCTFAYYLTQLPFVGAFTYPHGLLFFLMPAALALLAGRISLNFRLGHTPEASVD